MNVVSIGGGVAPGRYALHSRFDHAVNLADGEHLVAVVDGVIGCGPLGLLHIAKARMLGAGEIIAVDLLPGRLEVALTLGATRTVCNRDMSQGELAAELLELTEGGGDVVVEAAGVPDVVPTVFDATRPGGLSVMVGNFSDLGAVGIAPNRHLVSRGIRVIGVSGQEASGYLSGMRQMARDAAE